MSSTTFSAVRSPAVAMSGPHRVGSSNKAAGVPKLCVLSSRTPKHVSKPFSGTRKAEMQPRLALRPIAAAGGDSKEVFGMDTSEGFFGFNPFAELWVGRLAMMGFVTSVVEEAVTGNGTLRQIGIDTPSAPLLSVMLTVFGGAILASTAATLVKAQDGSMPVPQIARFRSFFGLDREAADIAETRKNTNDPVRSAMTDNAEDISAARAEGTVADKFLSDESADAAAASTAMKATSSTEKGTSVSLDARADIIEQAQFNSELAYAKSVEMENGRYAMLGFLAAVLVEAGTGHGIIMQLIDIFKLVGLLGPESGF